MATTGKTSTTISPRLDKYVATRTASGSASKICGDEISVALSGSTLDETYALASSMLAVPLADLSAKYKERNLGQQRMILGNLVRGALKGKDEEKVAKARKVFDKEIKALRVVIDKRVKAAAAEKKANKERKEEEKKEKVNTAKEAKKLAEEGKAKAAADKANKAKPARVAAPKKAAAPKAPAKPAKK